jgi:hypothetical protein
MSGVCSRRPSSREGPPWWVRWERDGERGQGLRCKAVKVTGTCFCFYSGSNLLAMRCEKGHNKKSSIDG